MHEKCSQDAIVRRNNDIIMETIYCTIDPMGFPGGSDGKESDCNVGDLSSIPGWGRSPGEENGYPLQYSCLENSLARGAWWATVHGIAELDVTERLTLSLSRQYVKKKPQQPTLIVLT